jgi:hypothetical protein
MRFMVGGYLPLGYSALETQVSTPALPARSRDASLFSLGDVGLVPASLYWSLGPIHLNLYEAIIAPTGRYDDEDIVNVGRNYWSFDTVLGFPRVTRGALPCDTLTLGTGR